MNAHLSALQLRRLGHDKVNKTKSERSCLLINNNDNNENFKKPILLIFQKERHKQRWKSTK